MKMFDSRRAWMTHELQHHRRQWVCQECNDVFGSRNLFCGHSATHFGPLQDSELLELVAQAEKPADKILATACSLCDWETGLWEVYNIPPNDVKIGELYVPVRTFRRHLGRHMEQLALFALPP